MAVQMILPVFLLFLATVNGASLPTVPDCNEDDEFYKAGSVYKYNYVSHAESLAVGTTDRMTGLKLSCTVDLHAVGGCRYLLKVPDCKLTEVPSPGTSKKMTDHPRSDDLKNMLSANQVSFTMTKGDVRDVIAHENEPLTSLNIKRGIISTLQGSRKVDEIDGEVRTDVHGSCPATYQQDGDKYLLNIDMKYCHYPARQNYQFSPWSLMYNMTFLQNFMMVSNLKCEYQLTDSALNKATCVEKHVKRLYSHKNAELGVQTKITQTLQLKNSKADKASFDRNLKNKRLTDIIYEHEPAPEPTGQPDNFMQRASQMMSDLVHTSENELRVFTVTLFDELVDLLRESNDVLQFTEDAYSCNFPNGCNNDLETSLARNFLQDALMQCNSAPCLRGIRYLTTQDHMTSLYFNAMLFALTNVHVPNAAYVNELLEICKAKPTRMCLLSLSSVIHTYARRNRDSLQSNIPEAIKETVELLSGMIGDNCDLDGVSNQDLPRHERQEKSILALKAFGNLGAVAQQASNKVNGRILACVVNPNVADNVTLEAIKALRRMQSTPQMYSTLLGVVRNQKNPMHHRIVAYVVLAGHFPETKLYDDLAKILKNEKTIQLGNFITMHMQSVAAANDPALSKLDKTIMEALSNHDDVFVIKGTRPLTSSRYRQWAHYYKSPILRDVISRFGIDLNSGAAYEPYSFLPQGLMLNLTTTLFGRTFNLATLGGSLHGLEPVIEAILGPVGMFRDADSLQDVLKDIGDKGEEVLQRITDPGSATWVNHFDNDIEEKLGKIHESVVHEYTSQHPSATFNVKLFGDELAFTSLDLIKDRLSNALSDLLGSIDWDEKHIYYLTRVIRILDGNLKVPTIAGLPLTVGLEATLAVSFRMGGKANIAGLFQQPRSFSAEYFLNPSGSLVLVNKMELDIPEMACIGVRSNTTLYRSRQREGEITYENRELNVHIKVPEKPQEVLSIYRTNQLVRNHHFEDLPDYDINRVDKTQCYPDSYSGLKYCRHKSYADVTDKEKPWFPLAGNAEYRLWFERDDPDMTEYKLQIKRDSAEDAPETTHIIHFEAPGTKWRREIHGVLTRKPETREFSLKVTVPEKPHFFIDGSRKAIIENGEVIGYDSHFDAQFRPNRPVSLDFVRKSKDGWDRKIVLKLPERQYTVINILRREANKKVLDQQLHFESFVDHSYMHDILPDQFWETNRKAYVKLHSDIEMDAGDSGWERNSQSTLSTPKSVIEVVTERIRKPDQKRALHVKATKKTIPSNEVQTYLFIDYDLSINHDGDKTSRHHVAELQLPRTHLKLEINRDMDVADDNIDLSFRREKFVAKNSADESYGGLMEGSVANRFDVKSFDINLKMKIHDHARAKHGNNVPAGEPVERTIDAELKYPRENDYHTVNLHSHIIKDKEQQNAITSFQHDYTLAISFWDLNFQGNTKYTRRSTDIKLDHDGKVTHVPTGNEGTYVVHLKSDIPMRNLDMQQTFHSPNFHFEHKVNGFKVPESDGTEATFLSMNISSKSPVWDGLDAELTQVFYLHKERSWEKMSFKHKLLDVDVKSDFKIPIGAHYNKEFHINSKNKVLPNFNLHLHYHDYTMYTAHIEYPDDHRNVYAVGEVDPGYRGIVVQVSHNGPQTQGNETVAQFVLKIISPHRIITECDVDEESLKKAKETYRTRFAKTWDAWVQMKNDPNYPMNKLLKPYINADTLAEFQERLRNRIQTRRAAIRAAISDALRSLSPFVETFITVGKNAVHTLESAIYKAESDKPRTYTAWLWNYFEVTELLEKYAENLRTRARGGGSDTRSGANIINHPFTWNSLLELPRPSPRLFRIFQQFRERVAQGGYRKSLFDRRRVAMVFQGEKTRNVYTFDGNYYQFPGFSNNNCMFLLAHDFAYRHFSVLGQENTVHFLFPELAVTMDRKGKVSLNGSNDAIALPYHSDSHRIHLSHDGPVFHLKSRYGLDADCDAAHGHCLFYMSFWNHNKTLGLLGNNDNEASNDLKLMDGKVTENIHEFVSNYELTGRPICVDKKKMGGKKQCGKGANPKCEQYFGKNNYRSEMYAAFDIIDPKPFLQACEQDTDCGASSVCPTINAYVALSKARYVELDRPAECK